jgi:hypothetical protein
MQRNGNENFPGRKGSCDQTRELAWVAARRHDVWQMRYEHRKRFARRLVQTTMVLLVHCASPYFFDTTSEHYVSAYDV